MIENIRGLTLKLARLSNIQSEYDEYVTTSSKMHEQMNDSVDELQSQIVQLKSISGVSTLVEISNERDRLRTVVQTINEALEDRKNSSAENKDGGDHATVLKVIDAVAERLKPKRVPKLTGQQPSL